MKASIVILFLFFTSITSNALCVSGNCEDGFGTYVWEDGDMYSGFWKNGKKHYFGMNFWKGGDFWFGLYKNGERKPGHGIYAWDDGDKENRNNRVYYNEKGCVSGDCEDGWGVYIWEDGDLYAGSWKNGKQHYFGAKFWKEGDFFLGLYKEGKRTSNEHGYYVFKSNKSKTHLGPVRYSTTGCVQGDCDNGFGTYIWKNGDLHTGYWKEGKSHFIAFKFWNEKDFFIGLYKNGERKRRGLYVYEDGDLDIRNEKVIFNNLTFLKSTQNIEIENGGNQAAPQN
ncbi:hypothetical protein [uncultured Polaribacter sp.]|uniref:hypothetical protein n=1 Tax=uncultured Polaribacter sp. TaxID=174711 RepID=UPI00260E4504|nr:hypothetical protein [uncultured Polaribacter sp.]